MQMKIRWTFIMILVLMSGCGKEIPKDIIKPDKMENVLYDYHMAMSMFNNQYHMENHQKNSLMNYIYDKHQITAAVFDSSMVWYTREARELTAIYDKLEKRFKREHNHMESLLSNRDGENSMQTSYGDTVDIWRKRDFYWMSKNSLSGLVAFDFKTDTNFHERDAFLWNLDVHFFSEGKVAMGLNVIYQNDSIVGESRIVDKSGKQRIYLYTDSTYKIKALNGFVTVLGDSAQTPRVLVKDISLVRYHRPLPDSLSNDSIKAIKTSQTTDRKRR